MIRLVLSFLKSVNFCQIPSPFTGLAALERLKKMYNVVSTPSPLFLIGSFFIRVGNKVSYKSLHGIETHKIEHGSMESAALERLKKSPHTYNGSNVVSTLVLTFLDGSSSFLQVSITTIKALISLNCGHT